MYVCTFDKVEVGDGKLKLYMSVLLQGITIINGLQLHSEKRLLQKGTQVWWL